MCYGQNNGDVEQFVFILSILATASFMEVVIFKQISAGNAILDQKKLC